MDNRLNQIKNLNELAQLCCYKVVRLAGFFGVSVRKLERFFRARFGQSPHHWLNELRMRRAVELLKDGSRTKEVAVELRYLDVAHFVRSFKRRFGVTPQQFAGRAPVTEPNRSVVAF